MSDFDQSELFPDLPKEPTLESLQEELQNKAISALLDQQKPHIRMAGPPSKRKEGKKDIVEAGEETNWLNGVGEFKRKILFLAPAPRATEIDQQYPLAGKPAFRLAQTLDQGVGINLEADCRLTYLIKYPVPKLDSLSRADIEFSIPILQEEIKRLQPSVVVCLGTNVLKAVTPIHKDVDEYVGNTLFSEVLNCEVGVVWPSTTVLSASELEDDWILDLRSVLQRHQPICQTNWEEQDELPVHRPTNIAELTELVDDIVEKKLDLFALDTEFVPGRSWLETVMFKVTIATEDRSIDLHLLEPKQGYKARYIPPNIGKFKEVPDKYYTGKRARFFFASEEELEQYLKDFPTRKHALEVYIGDYEWTFEGTEEEVRDQLIRMFCRKGNQIWGHNAREDYKLLLKMGVNVLPYVTCDTITLGKCVEEKQRLALEPMSRKWLGAPSHKLALSEWLNANSVYKGKLPYIFIPRKIQDPYATTDARRTFDLREPLLAELNRQHQESVAAKEPSIRDAYFHAKMPEYFALLEMEILGQPIDPAVMVACMDWYEAQRKRLLQECIDEVLELTGWDSFNPDSPEEVGRLLFDVLKLTPLYTTDSPPIPWDEVQQLPPEEQATKRPAADQETLEMLSVEHPISRKLNTCRILGTLEKNYLRKGARWYCPPEESEEEEVFTLSHELPEKQTGKRKSVEKYLADDFRPEEYWEEVHKDRDSRAISQVISDNGYVYTNYRELLETDRLASYPNVSAIKKGEEDEIGDLVGTKPPTAIRNIISPHELPVDMIEFGKQLKQGKGLDIIAFSRPKEEREWVFIESDWGTGEVWYLVVISNDTNGIDIMGNPERDIHASVARNMFPKTIPADMADLTVKKTFKKLRDAAKPFVFGIPYGRGAAALVRQLNMEEAKRRQKLILKGEDPGPFEPFDPEQGDDFIKSYQQTLPQGWQYLQTQRDRVEYPGYLVSPWGFRRRFPTNISSKAQLSAYQREASNWQIQHGIACVMMEATKAYLDIKQKSPRMPMFLCDILHDATKYVAHASILDEVKDIIEYIMDSGLSLPFKPGAKLRHSIDVAFNWCAEDIDISQVERKELDWNYATKVIPTAAISEQMVSGLRHEQIRPELYDNHYDEVEELDEIPL